MHQAASQSHGHVTRLPERRLLAHTSTESNDYPDSVPSSVWSSRATQSSITTDGMASSRHTTDTRSSASASTAIAISGATEYGTDADLRLTMIAKVSCDQSLLVVREHRASVMKLPAHNGNVASRLKYPFLIARHACTESAGTVQKYFLFGFKNGTMCVTFW